MKSAKYLAIAAFLGVMGLSVAAQERAVSPTGGALPIDSVAVSRGADAQKVNQPTNQPVQQANIQRPTKRTTNWSRIKDLFE